MGSVMTALVATGLVATGTLVSSWALILIGTLIQLGIHAAQNTDIRLLARQITWDDGPTIAAIAIFARLRQAQSCSSHRLPASATRTRRWPFRVARRLD
jgi:hypothetical protein